MSLLPSSLGRGTHRSSSRIADRRRTARRRVPYSRRLFCEFLEDRRLLSNSVTPQDVSTRWTDFKQSSLVSDFMSIPLIANASTFAAACAVGEKAIASFLTSMGGPVEFKDKVDLTITVGIEGEARLGASDAGNVHIGLATGYNFTFDFVDRNWTISRFEKLSFGAEVVGLGAGIDISAEFFITVPSIDHVASTDWMTSGITAAVEPGVGSVSVGQFFGIPDPLYAEVSITAKTNIRVDAFLQDFVHQPSLDKGIADVLVPYYGDPWYEDLLYGLTSFAPYWPLRLLLDASQADTPIGVLAHSGNVAITSQAGAHVRSGYWLGLGGEVPVAPLISVAGKIQFGVALTGGGEGEQPIIQIQNWKPTRPDLVAPRVSSYSYNANADGNIWVDFSKAIDPTTLSSNTVQVVAVATGVHTAALKYDAPARELTIDPNTDFAYAETVTVSLANAIRDTLGNKLYEPVSFSFTVNKRPLPAPVSISVSADAGPSPVDPGQPLLFHGTATFDNGVPVSNGTAVVTLGGQSWTAPFRPDGTFSTDIVAPTTPRTDPYTAHVDVSARAGGRNLSGSADVGVVVEQLLPVGCYLSFVDTAGGYHTNASGDIVPEEERSLFSPKETDGLITILRVENVTKDIVPRVKLLRPDGTQYGDTYRFLDSQAALKGESWHWWYWGWEDAIPKLDQDGTWSVVWYLKPIGGTTTKVATVDFTYRYEFTEHRMAKGVQTTSPYDPLSPANTFFQTDTSAYTWMNLNRLDEDISVKWDWYDPRGQLYFTYTRDPVSTGNTGGNFQLPYDWYRVWGWTDIAGHAAATKCGDWRVDVQVKDPWGNWILQYTDFFQILESPFVTPTASVTSSTAHPIETQPISLTFSAADNTYLKDTWLCWDDGQAPVASVLDQSQTSPDYGYWFDSSVERWEQFTSSAGSLAKIRLSLARWGDPGDVDVSVKDRQGSTLWSTRVPEANILSGSNWLDLPVAPPLELTPGQVYRLTVTGDKASASPDNRYFWNGQRQGAYPGESDVSLKANQDYLPGYDYAFETYASPFSYHSQLSTNVYKSSLSKTVDIGSYSAGQRIEYWIVASDTSGNRVETPHRTVVVEPEVVTSPKVPVGPATVAPAQRADFLTGGSTTNLGAAVEYQFDWGDGAQSAWGALTGSHSWDSVGSRPVRARARSAVRTDRVSGWSDAGLLTVVDPAITSLTTDAAKVAEGCPVILTGTFVDPDPLDQHVAVIDWGDGASDSLDLQLGSRTFSKSHVYAAETATGGPDYTIKATVTDGGYTDLRTTTVTVIDFVPVVTILGNSTIPEGGTFVGSGSFVDPGPDTWTGTVDYGDGSGVTPLMLNADKTFNLSHLYADDVHDSQGNLLSYPITVTIMHDDGTVGTGTLPVTVTNVAPSLWIKGKRTVKEGDTLNLPDLGMFTDPGFDNPENPLHQPGGTTETFTYTIDWGDGTIDHGPPPPIAVTQGSAGVLTRGVFSGSHSYKLPNTYSVIVSVMDDDQGISPTRVMTIVVTNVPPTITNVGVDRPQYVEGDTVTLIGSFSDPGDDKPFSAAVVWGDGSTSPGNVDQDHRTFSAQHVYQDNSHGVSPPTYTISVTVSDTSGGTSAPATFAVPVSNGAPSVSVVGDQTNVPEGSLLDLPNLATFTDPGVLDKHTYTIDWGDGTPVEGGIVDQDVRTVRGSHVYADNGIYVVAVTLTDEDNGADTQQVSVTVSNVAPTIHESAILPPAVQPGNTVSVPFEFTDPGYNNPAVTPPTQEAFVYQVIYRLDAYQYVDHGSVTDVTQGHAGVLTHGRFTSQVTVPSVPTGTYQVSITASVADDDGGIGTITGTIPIVVGGVGALGTGSLAVVPTQDNGGMLAEAGMQYLTLDADDWSASPSTDGGDVSPTVFVVGNQTIDEGVWSVVDIATFSDPDSEGPFTYRIDWGDGTARDSGMATIDLAGPPTAGSVNGQHTYTCGAASVRYVVAITITDNENGSSTEEFEVTVRNLPPTASIGGVPAHSPEGTPITLQAEVTDVGTLDTFRYAWSVTKNGCVYRSTGTQSIYAFTPDNDATYVVTLAVSDQGDAPAPVVSATVVVDNVPPTATLLNDGPVAEGSTADMRFSGQFDPSSADTAAGFKYSFDFDNDGVFEVYRSESASAIVPVGYLAEGPGMRTVMGRIEDKDGGLTDYTTTITVDNVAPVISDLAVTSVRGGETSTLTASITDPGTLDTFTLIVDWGDGSAVEVFAYPAGATDISEVHRYIAAGTFSVNATLSDDDGGSGTGSVDVVISNAAPTLADLPDEIVLGGGAPLHLVLGGHDADGDTLFYSVSSDSPLLSVSIPKQDAPNGNRCMRITVKDYGEMVFELFEGQAPNTTARIIEIAESGWYANRIFHRVIDGFIIQGGSSDGLGIGGTGQKFDDEYHADLQFTSPGLLAMAKAGDDTNDSQFFITDVPSGGFSLPRWLDFNYTIFGMITDGDDVREAVSKVQTNTSNRPLQDVVIESVEIFRDTQNAVMLIGAPDGSYGSGDVTVIVSDGKGGTATKTIRVNVVPDTSNGNPFLGPIEPIQMDLNTPYSFQLDATDVEGDPIYYRTDLLMPIDDVTVSVTSEGMVTITPANGFNGKTEIAFRVGPTAASLVPHAGTFDEITIDSQVVTIQVSPLSAGGPYTVAEGGTVELKATAVANTVNPSGIWTFTWDFDGDGQFDDAVGADPDFSAVGLDGPSQAVVAVQIVDELGDSYSAQATIRVTNVPPTVDITNVPSEGLIGSLVNLSSIVSDPGTPDTHELVWAVTVGGVAVDSGSGVDFAFVPNAAGAHVISVTATDDDGESAADAATVIVGRDIGTVDFRILHGLSLTGESIHFQLTTAHPGFLTLEVIAPKPPKSARARLYGVDPLQNPGAAPLAVSALSGENQRVDWEAAQGETYFVEVYGSNPDFDLRIANLVYQSGTNLTVFGTTEGDTFEFSASDDRTITINGVKYSSFADAEVTAVGFNGGDGYDRVSMFDSPGDETLEAWSSDTAVFSNTAADAVPDFTVTVHDYEEMHVYASSEGHDTAKLYGTAGNDKFKSEPMQNYAKLYGAAQYNRVKFFDEVDVYAGSAAQLASPADAGNDLARLWDTNGDDTFCGGRDLSEFSGPGFDIRLHDYRQVCAYGTNAGNDLATLVDSALKDELQAKPHKSEIFDMTTGGDVYKVTARGFSMVRGEANNTEGTLQNGGRDKAKLYGTLWDDLVAAAEHWLHYDFSKDGNLDRLYEILAFESVTVRTTEGGRDTRTVTDPLVYELLFEEGWEES